MRQGGIILAAGRSARMGHPKPLLRLGGRTFLELGIETLGEGGCRPVVAVLGAVARAVEDPGADSRAEASEADVAVAAGAVVVRNPDPGSEQIDSLRLGLRALPDDATAAVVLPVDHPLVRAATVRALIERHRERPDAVLRATSGGKPGHPTLFPREVWPRLFRDPLPEGARSVLSRAGVEVVDVPVDDAGVHTDIDTPGAYRRAVER